MLFFEISIFASDVFVSKNRPKGHGILLFLVMESHEKSWNLNFQKEYEPCLRRPAGRQYCMPLSQQPFNRSLPIFQQLLLNVK